MQDSIDDQPDGEGEWDERESAKWVSYVSQFSDKQRESRYQLEKRWFLNLAYYNNLMWVSWNDSDRTLREPPAPSYRVRLSVPYVLEFVDTMLAKLLQSKPIFYVQPASNADEDVVAAETAERLAAFDWRLLEMDRLAPELMKWVLTCGTAFLHPYWDPKAGEMWTDEEEPGKEGTYFVGNPGMRVISPFELEIDPTARHISEAKRVLYKRFVSIEDARDMVPEEIRDRVQASNAFTEDNVFDTRYLGLMARGGHDAPKALDDMVLVQEMWERPSGLKPKDRKKSPKGRRILIVGGVAPKPPQPNPHDDIEMPFVQFNAFGSPGRLWAMSAPDLIRQLNYFYNRMMSQLMENIQLHNRPKVTASSGCEIHDENMDNEPGEVVRYADGTEKPSYMSPPSMAGSGFWDNINRVFSDMEEALGIRQVSRGGTPNNVGSGIAISMLLEQDDTRLALIKSPMEDGLAAVGAMDLKIRKQFTEEPRLVQITGDDNRADVLEFMGADLRDNVDLRVETGSSLPSSKFAKRSLLFDLWEKGVVDQQDRPRFWKLLELNVLGKAYEEELADERLADYENLMMKRGVAQKVEKYYDHAVHKARHNLERKRPRFQMLEKNIRELFDAHVLWHEQMEAQAQAEQPPAPGAAPGGPPQPGAPMPGQGAAPPSLPPMPPMPLEPPMPEMPPLPPSPMGEMPPMGPAPGGDMGMMGGFPPMPPSGMPQG